MGTQAVSGFSAVGADTSADGAGAGSGLNVCPLDGFLVGTVVGVAGAVYVAVG